jgi:hypothetical protein
METRGFEKMGARCGPESLCFSFSLYFSFSFSASLNSALQIYSTVFSVDLAGVQTVPRIVLQSKDFKRPYQSDFPRSERETKMREMWENKRK